MTKEKNKKISDTLAATRAKRKTQSCKTFRFKIDWNNLNRKEKEQIKMMFIEAKWIYNYVLSRDNVFALTHKDLDTITHLDKDKNVIEHVPAYVPASVKQEILKQIQSQIKGLATLKSKGHEVGKLRFISSYNSINFRQYGTTHEIRGNKIKLQGIKRPIKVMGIKQLSKYKDLEYANAKLLTDGIDYYIAVTCFCYPDVVAYENKEIGIDFGIKTSITTSNGEKYDVCIEESEKLRRLQAKLARQTKGSNNSNKTIFLIKKEYRHISNKKNDVANKIVHDILSKNEIVVMQDEQIAEWHCKDGMSAKVQHSILGRIKTKLAQSKQVVVLSKWLPTSKMCFACGSKNENLQLSDRTFVCPVCGATEDRDIHAAKNMLEFYHRQ